MFLFKRLKEEIENGISTKSYEILLSFSLEVMGILIGKGDKIHPNKVIEKINLAAELEKWQLLKEFIDLQKEEKLEKAGKIGKE